MSEAPETVTLHLDELLRDSKRQATSMSLPLAVHYRLDVLAKLAAAVSATRAEIIGMLISESDLDAAWLESSIVSYRKSTVREVVPPHSRETKDADSNVIELPVRHPGRPPTHRVAG
jgi:hypothetical protein